jgi:hypothetical protein
MGSAADPRCGHLTLKLRPCSPADPLQEPPEGPPRFPDREPSCAEGSEVGTSRVKVAVRISGWCWL